MRLRGPIRAPGDLPGRRPLASPTCSPGSRCRAGTPAPEPAEKFRRCKREKSQLGRTPAPTQSAAPPPQPDPWRRRPWPPRTLPRAEGGGGGRGDLHLGPSLVQCRLVPSKGKQVQQKWERYGSDTAHVLSRWGVGCPARRTVDSEGGAEWEEQACAESRAWWTHRGWRPSAILDFSWFQ